MANEKEYLVCAVLLPLVEQGGQVFVLFEVRAAGLDRQPGEICFPGGKVEESEISNPEKTALREACEELGLKEENIELLAPLDYLVTPLGVLIYPFVGKITAPEKIKPSPGEVEEIFTVPLEFFLKIRPAVSSADVGIRYAEDFPFDRVPSTYRPGWQKRWTYLVYHYHYEGRFIWGLTARVLVDFISNLKAL